MLSIKHKLILQKQMQSFATNNVFLDIKVKHKSNNHKNPCRRRESNPEALAFKADA